MTIPIVVLKSCIVCSKESKHYLHYGDIEINWEGYYCDKHFLEKLNALNRIWNKRLKDVKK